MLQQIRKATKARGKVWTFERQAGAPEIWKCGSTVVVIPRHNEIKPPLVLGIFRRLESELGKDWWK
jgi:hypothetical protein